MSKTSQISIWMDARNKYAKPAWLWEKVEGTLDFNAGYRRDMRVADMVSVLRFLTFLHICFGQCKTSIESHSLGRIA